MLFALFSAFCAASSAATLAAFAACAAAVIAAAAICCACPSSRSHCADTVRFSATAAPSVAHSVVVHLWLLYVLHIECLRVCICVHAWMCVQTGRTSKRLKKKSFLFECMCVRACVCKCQGVCVCARVRASVHARVTECAGRRACVCKKISQSQCVRAFQSVLTCWYAARRGQSGQWWMKKLVSAEYQYSHRFSIPAPTPPYICPFSFFATVPWFSAAFL